MKRLPRIALIGCGRIGQVHARNLASLRELCDFVAIDDWNLEAAQKASTMLDVPKATSDSEEVLTDPDVDAVIIASSTETHAPYIQMAAEHGKAIFTEKPIALDIATTDRALEAVRQAGVMLQVGFQRRFDAGYLTAKTAIENGDLGSLEMIRDAMRDPEPPPAAYIKRSGGLFRDMTIHNFDCVRWLMGEDPIEVHTTASTLINDDFRDANDVDTSIVTMRFPSGAIASIENSRRSGFGYDVRTEIFGSKGAIMVGESRATPVRRYMAEGVKEDHQHFFLERFREAYKHEMVAFLTAIRDGSPPSVSGEDGRAALMCAYAAEQSLTEHRSIPVDLKEVYYV